MARCDLSRRHARRLVGLEPSVLEVTTSAARCYGLGEPQPAVGKHGYEDAEVGGSVVRELGQMVDGQDRRSRGRAATCERDALGQLRVGDVDAAIDAYTRHGRFRTGDTAERSRAARRRPWWLARDEHGREAAVMVAARRSDGDNLNARARHRMIAAAT